MADSSDTESRDTDSSGASTASIVIAWFTRGVFKHFLFEKETQDAKPGELKNMTGSCNLCPNKRVKGRYLCTTNFLRHLKKHHRSKYDEYMSEKQKASVAYSKRDVGKKRSAEEALGEAEHPKRNKLFEFYQPLPKAEQDHIDELQINYLISGLNLRARLLTEYRVRKEIRKKFIAFQSSLIAMLAKVQFVCLTADCWSGRHRGFLGVTVHWLDPSSLKRFSSALAIRRFKGSHTYDKIAAQLDSIIKQFGLVGKVVRVVTDNGSNFVKAFEKFQPQPVNQHESEDEGSEWEDLRDYDDVDDEDESPTVPVSAFDVLDAGPADDNRFGLDDDDYNEPIVLPPHFRCASHTLNLIGSTDADKIITSCTAFKQTYRKVMGKINALWNINGRSSLASDETVEILGRYLPRPVATRWNSMFDCISVLIAQSPSKLSELLQKLKIPTITNIERSFLIEYLSILSPLAMALDRMQGEINCYLGLVLPTIVKLQQLLSSLDLSDASSSVRFDLLDRIDDRFGHLFKEDSYVLATVCHPRFKLAWLKTEEEKASVKRKLEAVIGTRAAPVLSPVSDQDDFLSFDDRQPQSRSELERYLSDKDKSLSMLDRYPTIKALFIKYNTSLPSSAPVERLFSQASLVLTAHRSRLSDLLLEHLILLKICNDL